MKRFITNRFCGGIGNLRKTAQAFSLVEMLVAMAMLAVIVIGLYSVFDHTQKALRSNNAQVDVMETGRAAMDLLSRELETAMATGQMTNTNCFHMTNAVSVYNTTTRDGFTMRLNDGTTRTNVLEDLLFMSRSNNWWTADGYFVGAFSASNNLITNDVVWKSGMGTLYRSSAQNVPPLMQFRNENLFGLLVTNLVSGHWYLTNSYQIADGVVHFRVRPLDAYGQVMVPLKKDSYGNYMKDGNGDFIVNPGILPESNPVAHEYQMRFASNQLPAFLELELGLLPPQVLQRVRAIENADAQRNYLTNQANAVVLFNKVIRLRNAQNER
jgi:prepilin-type N-terminal cleavage/methylation domain-containing protein